MINLYPSPSDQNFTSIVSIFTYINDVTEIFGWFLLLCIYLVFMFGISYYKKDISLGVAIAGFITVIIGVLFRIVNLINSFVLGIIITIAVMGLILLLFTKTREWKMKPQFILFLIGLLVFLYAVLIGGLCGWE